MRFLSYWAKQHFDWFDLYLKTAWPTKISIYYIIFQKCVDYIDTEHKTC